MLVTGTTTRKGRKKMERKHYHKKKGGEAHIGKEWDSDEGSTDSSFDEDTANIAIHKVSSPPMLATSVTWTRRERRRRYTL
jgi:hypothetical protein